MRPYVVLCAFSLLFAAGSAGASDVVPAQPLPFQHVALRSTVDGCSFDPQRTYVRSKGNTIRIVTLPRYCLLPGPTEVVELKLGAYPVGAYDVEIYHSDLDGAEPVERLHFDVHDYVELAIYPPPIHPLADYNGLWWTPGENGWGLSLHQGSTDTLVGALFVFDADAKPRWYTFQGGAWTDNTHWRGSVVRSAGPDVAAPVYDAGSVRFDVVGEASLDFTQTPGTQGQARLEYSIGATHVKKTIQRMGL